MSKILKLYIKDDILHRWLETTAKNEGSSISSFVEKLIIKARADRGGSTLPDGDVTPFRMKRDSR